MKKKKNVYFLFENNNADFEIKHLLEELQQMFVIPEGKIDLVFDVLFKAKMVIMEKNIDKHRSLHLINYLLTILDQDQIYFNQYNLFSVFGLSKSKMNYIDHFLLGPETTELFYYSQTP